MMFGYGMYQGHPTMTLIGVFIFFAARQEFQVMVRQNKLTTLKVTDIMLPVEHILFLGMTLQDAKEKIREKKELSFIVWSRPGIPAGYLMRDRILSDAPSEGDHLIDAWVIPAPVALPPEFSAGQVHAVMRQHKLPLVLVFDKINYLGVVQWETVAAMAK
jgi:CBS domain containing-hemolysin-like protein